MEKKLSILVVGVCVLVLTGCKTPPKPDPVQVLSNRLKECIASKEKAEKELDIVEAERDGLRNKLAGAEESKRKLTRLLGEIKKEAEEKERQRRELQNLIKDISGAYTYSSREGVGIGLKNDILFSPGKVALNDTATESLNAIVQYLKTKKAQSIRIDGHTDGVPITHSQWKDNYHLSAMRAHAVMNYLKSKGIPAERMHVVGFGPNRPKETPKSKSDEMPANRRVEILLVPEKGKTFEDILKEFQP